MSKIQFDLRKFYLFFLFQNLQNITYLFLQSILTTSAIVLITFIFCFFGNNVTIKFNETAVHAYNSSWYLCPIHLQRYIILMMQRSQRPLYLTGYKVTRCSLDSFTSVRHCLLLRKTVAINVFF